MQLDLMVFAKPPVPGEVKTRLAASVGTSFATALATAFLADSLDRFGEFAERVDATPVLVGDSADRETFLQAVPSLAARTELRRAIEPWSYRSQGTGHLGERMERAIEATFGRERAALLLGADTPHLPTTLLERACAAVAGGDVVLGPSDDGGFYTLGLPGPLPGWSRPFREPEWGTDEVLARTRALIEAWDQRFVELVSFRDFDYQEDLVQWVREAAEKRSSGSSEANPSRTWELARRWLPTLPPGERSVAPDAGEAGSSRDSS